MIYYLGLRKIEVVGNLIWKKQGTRLEGQVPFFESRREKSGVLILRGSGIDARIINDRILKPPRKNSGGLKKRLGWNDWNPVGFILPCKVDLFLSNMLDVA